MGEKQSLFSMIIPTYERPVQLAACLQALYRLDYARERRMNNWVVDLRESKQQSYA